MVAAQRDPGPAGSGGSWLVQASFLLSEYIYSGHGTRLYLSPEELAVDRSVLQTAGSFCPGQQKRRWLLRIQLSPLPNTTEFHARPQKKGVLKKTKKQPNTIIYINATIFPVIK